VETEKSPPELFDPARAAVEEEIPMEPPATAAVASAVEEPEAGKTDNPYSTAIGLYQQGQYAEAIHRMSPQLLDHPNDTQALALLARSQANLGRLKDALELSEKALTLDKLNPGLHYLHAMILQELNLTDAAMQSLKRALYLDQNYVLCYFALGNLARRQGKLNESARYFETALSLLNFYGRDETLPESEGITAGRLIEIIDAYRGRT